MTQPSPTATPTSQTPLEKVVAKYREYVHGRLDALVPIVSQLRTASIRGDRISAKKNWLSAQLTWQQIGAAYGALGAVGDAISGLASGLPLGPDDPGFSGLHRIEYGLYNDQPMSTVLKYVEKLGSDLDRLRATYDHIKIDPHDMPIRCHEVLEDTLRDHLSDQSDYGSGMAYALTSADVLATREYLKLLKPLIPTPVLGHNAYDLSMAALDVLDQRLQASMVNRQWPYYPDLSKADRQPVNAAVGGALEVLYVIPEQLENLN